MEKTTFKNETCAQCRYCDKHHMGGTVCRKRPPVVFGNFAPRQTPQGVDMAPLSATSWPEVNPLSDWCAEFEMRAAGVQ